MPYAPWYVIDAKEKSGTALMVIKTVADVLEKALEKKRAGKEAEIFEKPVPPDRYEKGILAKADLTKRLEEAEYRKKLDKLQKRLEVLHGELYRLRIPVILGFEGWDAAGKGGNIRRVAEALDPRGYEVVPIAACVVLAVLFLVYDRSIFRIQLRHFPIFLGTGIVSILFFTLCYFNSQQVSSLAVSAILLYTAPTFVVLLSALFWREKITKQKLLALIIAFFGCCCVAGLLGGSLAVTPKGLLLGIGSGLFYSSYTLFGRVALSHYPPFTVTFYTFLVAGIGSLFLIRPQELAIVTGSGRGFLLALGLILISTVLPYLFYTKGLNDLGDGGKASILASVEPVVASLVGILVFGEPMGIGTLVGLVCILVSIYILR